MASQEDSVALEGNHATSKQRGSATPRCGTRRQWLDARVGCRGWSGAASVTVLALGREVLGDFEAVTRREWLVTNGLGSFACGTLAGLNTRRYHGLLVASLRPPL